MSFQLFRAIRESNLRPTVKLVAYTLALRTDPTGECYPALGTIAADAGLSRSSVQRLIAELETITDQPFRLERLVVGNGRSPTLYRLSAVGPLGPHDDALRPQGETGPTVGPLPTVMPQGPYGDRQSSHPGASGYSPRGLGVPTVGPDLPIDLPIDQPKDLPIDLHRPRQPSLALPGSDAPTPKPKTRSPSPKPSSLPQGWAPKPGVIRWARCRRDVAMTAEGVAGALEAFAAHAVMTGRKTLDWHLASLQWLRKERERNPRMERAEPWPGEAELGPGDAFDFDDAGPSLGELAQASTARRAQGNLTGVR